MPSLSVDFDKRQLASVEKRLRDMGANVKKVIGAAVNDTAKQARTDMSRRIRDKVNIKKKDIDKHIHFRRASPASPTASLTLSKSPRIGLEYFGARQNKSGVSYKIEKGGARKTIRSAFIPTFVNDPARRGLVGKVLVRVGKGRLPIRRPKGISAWGVFVKSGMIGHTKESIRTNLRKNLDRRVNLELLRKAGRVKR